MVEFGIVKIDLNVVEEEAGIILKKTNLTVPKKGKGRLLCFTLKDDPGENISSFLYEGKLYMIDKQDDNYFEAIEVEFKNTK